MEEKTWQGTAHFYIIWTSVLLLGPFNVMRWCYMWSSLLVNFERSLFLGYFNYTSCKIYDPVILYVKIQLLNGQHTKFDQSVCLQNKQLVLKALGFLFGGDIKQIFKQTCNFWLHNYKVFSTQMYSVELGLPQAPQQRKNNSWE